MSAAHPAAIEIDHVTQYFDSAGNRVLAVDDVTLTIPKGQFVSIVGPSGCGKTTVMNMVAGLVHPTSGEVRIDGKVRETTGRDIGYMFARDGLLPWRTARRNVELGLEFRGLSSGERRSRAEALLDRVGLSGFRDYFPKQLSQGMRQRVAIARTLALDPSIFLLDEPFAALDAQTRIVLQNEFLRLWETLGNTVMFVTHDLGEAIALADRVIVFSRRPGRIMLDIPVDLPRPRDVATIRFSDDYNELSRKIWDAMEHDATAPEPEKELDNVG